MIAVLAGRPGIDEDFLVTRRTVFRIEAVAYNLGKKSVTWNRASIAFYVEFFYLSP